MPHSSQINSKPREPSSHNICTSSIPLHFNVAHRVSLRNVPITTLESSKALSFCVSQAFDQPLRLLHDQSLLYNPVYLSWLSFPRTTQHLGLPWLVSYPYRGLVWRLIPGYWSSRRIATMFRVQLSDDAVRRHITWNYYPNQFWGWNSSYQVNNITRTAYYPKLQPRL